MNRSRLVATLATTCAALFAAPVAHAQSVPADLSDAAVPVDAAVAPEPSPAEPVAATALPRIAVVASPPAPIAHAAPPRATDATQGPPVVAVVAGVSVRLTGTIVASVLATQGVQSFGLPTAVAPTSALNPAVLAHPDDPNLTFQFQQTRLGLIVGEGSPFRGQVEFDLAHFDESSPTVQAFPRVRIALLEWRFAPGQRVFLGQTWDVFGNGSAPLVSHSANIVGTLFQAGNVGFMRPQLGWSGRFGLIELTAAAGLQGANAGAAFGNVEQSLTPTGALRAAMHLGRFGEVGLSGLGTALRFVSGANVEQRRLALGGAAYADLTLGPVSLHSEAYLAQNLAGLGVNDLAQGRAGVDVADAGGYASARLQLGIHAFTAMAGGAAVLNPSAVVPGYALPAMAGGLGTPNLAAGPGMRWNTTAHVAYWFSPVHGLSFVLEPYAYYTRFALDPADAGRFSADRLALGAQLVALFQF